MASTVVASSKRKSEENSSISNKNAKKKKVPKNDSLELNNYVALSLQEIRESIVDVAKRVPDVPAKGIDPSNDDIVREWATELKTVLEEFNLLLMCVSPATYKWGSERSGAADQNLTMLSNELTSAQEQIASSVMPRLTNVLSPMVELVVKQSKTTKQSDGTKIKVNTCSQQVADPAFIELCRTILCRNAKMLRQVVLSNLNKVSVCIEDYLKATKKDSNHDRSGFSY
uniref:Proteasome activator PA28 C-terminal domain-containing protein n=1 Tax=Eucampia antarctica TaxID=49252 RepID=A0A7S2R2B4_9STRA|mmetsp:Transcript_14571/g.14044  ORF Transcript_14571/g.14044 Transcript_14571/m.14044 type:complete len:228 (+) Transcript_14571:70-753(+)|eukprot:CAMPEP_0197837724 /NCGR_PEP_ID=MMETSP1437-20131217/33082_1 /TAXON_ID=49252 ORGANISM="Eucampia antarctica, Strain CCMP1452" /NCGR_SAMPLE_ID=MMETSP1437 /ASSEMBLY_ACC=CAM_ASM_001096 /LENGTH=227 /DNA_ID=CAMNT_0043445017 /DNA_START=56 /DNA_END=739 /DNA_ORIENTATION=-